jgi:hypothetical protein
MIERMCDGTNIDHAQDFGQYAEAPLYVMCSADGTCPDGEVARGQVGVFGRTPTSQQTAGTRHERFRENLQYWVWKMMIDDHEVFSISPHFKPPMWQGREIGLAHSA